MVKTVDRIFLDFSALFMNYTSVGRPIKTDPTIFIQVFCADVGHFEMKDSFVNTKTDLGLERLVLWSL